MKYTLHTINYEISINRQEKYDDIFELKQAIRSSSSGIFASLQNNEDFLCCLHNTTDGKIDSKKHPTIYFINRTWTTPYVTSQLVDRIKDKRESCAIVVASLSFEEFQQALQEKPLEAKDLFPVAKHLFEAFKRPTTWWNPSTWALIVLFLMSFALLLSEKAMPFFLAIAPILGFFTTIFIAMIPATLFAYAGLVLITDYKEQETQFFLNALKGQPADQSLSIPTFQLMASPPENLGENQIGLFVKNNELVYKVYGTENCYPMDGLEAECWHCLAQKLQKNKLTEQEQITEQELIVSLLKVVSSAGHVSLDYTLLDYLREIAERLSIWGTQNKVQVLIVILWIVIFIGLFLSTVGYFMGDPNFNFIGQALDSLYHMVTLGAQTPPNMLIKSVITAMFLIAPLAIADTLKRIVSAFSDATEAAKNPSIDKKNQEDLENRTANHSPRKYAASPLSTASIQETPSYKGSSTGLTQSSTGLTQSSTGLTQGK